MTTTDLDYSTSRRDVLCRFGFASLVGLGGAAIAVAPAPDAEIIAICSELRQIEADTFVLMRTLHTIKDEEQAAPEVEALYERKVLTLEKLKHVAPPTTMAGVLALAETAIAAHRYYGADIAPHGHQCALVALESLVSGAAKC